VAVVDNERDRPAIGNKDDVVCHAVVVLLSTSLSLRILGWMACESS